MAIRKRGIMGTRSRCNEPADSGGVVDFPGRATMRPATPEAHLLPTAPVLVNLTPW
jgi:hypothetical protein